MKVLIIKGIEAGSGEWPLTRSPVRRGTTMDVDPATAAVLMARGYAVIAEVRRERAVLDPPEVR